MSRAYRIRVKESIKRDLKAEDRITTQLELLEVLPPEQMAQLLKNELKNRGYTEGDDGQLTRKDGDITVTIDPAKGTVTVSSEVEECVEIEGTREGYAYDDVGPAAKTIRKNLEQEVVKDLENRVEQQQSRLQAKASDRLEGHLCDLQGELDQAVNRVTAEALKQKAAQLGQIREISEDPESGSLSITLEV